MASCCDSSPGDTLTSRIYKTKAQVYLLCHRPANKTLPSLTKSSDLKGGYSQSQERHRKERCPASLTLCHDLPHSPSCDGMLGVPASSPSTKDHLRERPSPVLNKTFHCLSVVLLSHLYSSAQYFRFLLLCWFCFLTQTTRLKNRPAAMSCEKGDLLRQ